MNRPPSAPRIPHRVDSPHGARDDEYYWMRDDDPERKRPDVMAMLEAENAWCDAQMAPLRSLQDALVAELRSRIQEDDSSVPAWDNGYWYWRRFDTGAEYPVVLRRRGAPDGPAADAPDEVLLDQPALAQGHDYFSIGGYAVSPDNRWLAYAVDTVGRRMYRIVCVDLATGARTEEELHPCLPDLAWAADSRTLFYMQLDPQTLVLGTVYRHLVGTPQASDALVYDEPDTTLYTGLAVSASRRYVLIELSGFDTTELRAVAAADPTAEPQVILPRTADVRSYADHLGEHWYIRTNAQALNFRLVRAPADAPADSARWVDLVPARDTAALDDFALFDGAVAVEERVEANLRVRLLPFDGSPERVIEADEPAFAMMLGANLDPAARALRYVYSSQVTPPSTYDLDLATGARTLRKRQPVPNYDASLYAVERLWARGHDGVRIPVSLLARRDRGLRNGAQPVYLEGYGAYGLSSDPWFSSSVIALADRGFAVAIAHVRGGAELGQGWYEAGRLEHKANTFRDFIAVTEYLVAEGVCAAGQVFATGGSAGGLLIGAVANMAGHLYRGLALHVPFVDVVTTMLDETIPLTSTEWTQWGDPREPAAYARMLGYSPYDNIRRGPYPAMLVTTGLWDSQVQYFEPAKYVARLRARKTDANPLLFHVNTQAGHGGKSGRLERLEEAAREYAFFIGVLQGTFAR